MDLDRIYIGDSLTILKELPDNFIHTCVTSPPYWGLRDYKVKGQLGLEKTPEEYISKMVEVFREVRRVLREDGTLWLNLGDSYTSGGRKERDPGKSKIHPAYKGESYPDGLRPDTPSGFKPKNLVGIPWRVALALQADGYYLRSDIIWHKPNPMPESTKDRPTKSHEYIFLMSKSQRYYYDQEAVREPSLWAKDPSAGLGHIDYNGKRDGSYGSGQRSFVSINPAGRNIRSVWTIATQPYREAHFATFPEAIPERCIKAGTSERGCCPECGSPWRRVVDHKNMVIDRSSRTHEKGRTRSSGTMIEPATTKTIGWQPSCSCHVKFHYTDKTFEDKSQDWPISKCIVLDPFIGSGTVARVALRLNRHYIGIELNSKYVDLALKRKSWVQIEIGI